MPTLFTRTIGSVESVELELGQLITSTITFTLQCTYTQSAATNQTTITLTIRASSNNQKAPFRVSSYQITGNGGTRSGAESSQGITTRNIASVSKTLTHNLSGGLSFTSGAKITVEHWNVVGKTSTTFTLSGRSYSLPAIDVFSDLTFSDNAPYMGDAITINIAKPLVATGTKVYSVINDVETEIYEGEDDSFIYIIPNIAASITDSDYGTIRIYSKAYNDEFEYNAKSYNLDIYVPQSYVPTLTIGTITDQYNFGSFIGNYSLLNFPLSAVGNAGSTIVSYGIEVRQTDSTGTLLYSATNETSAASVSFEMPTPAPIGNIYVAARTTDSRNRTTYVYRTITLIPYAEPQISIATTRCDSDGTTNPVGNYIKVEVAWSITQIGTHNVLTEQIKTYLSTNGTTFTLVNSTSGSGYSGTVVFITALSSANVGYLYSTIKDSVSGQVVSSIKSIPKTLIPISFYDDGTNVGTTIGGIASESGFNVALPTKFKLNGEYGGILADYVVEQGISGDWVYKKWASGLAECWGSFTLNTRLNTAWGSLYISATNLAQQNYPFEFIKRPFEQPSVIGNGASAWPINVNTQPNTATKTASYTLVRNTTSSTSYFDYYVNIHVVGRWK